MRYFYKPICLILFFIAGGMVCAHAESSRISAPELSPTLIFQEKPKPKAQKQSNSNESPLTVMIHELINYIYPVMPENASGQKRDNSKSEASGKKKQGSD